MITQPCKLDIRSDEYFQLKVAKQVLEELTENMIFRIKDIYFDYGQNWMWTTIVAYDKLKNDSCFQVLCPRDWKEIINYANRARIKAICKAFINEYPELWNLK